MAPAETLSCTSACQVDRWQSPGDAQGHSGPFLLSHRSDHTGKEFLQGLRQVSGCSSHGFGPRLEEAAGSEGASTCPLAPRPKCRHAQLRAGRKANPASAGTCQPTITSRQVQWPGPIWGLIYGATRDGSNRQKLCRSRPAGHNHSLQQGTNLMPWEPTQMLKAKC